jgi:hypothetical protein
VNQDGYVYMYIHIYIYIYMYIYMYMYVNIYAFHIGGQDMHRKSTNIPSNSGCNVYVSSYTNTAPQSSIFASFSKEPSRIPPSYYISNQSDKENKNISNNSNNYSQIEDLSQSYSSKQPLQPPQHYSSLSQQQPYSQSNIQINKYNGLKKNPEV